MGIYQAYYNCRSEPFSLSPDPRFLYLSPSHREALAQLSYMVEQRKGFAVLTGEVGLGKTTVLRSLLERFGPSVRNAYIFNPPRSIPQLYAAIADQLDLRFDGVGSPAGKLNQFLVETYRDEGTVVLIFDEAQRLTGEVLEEIRIVSNLEAFDSKLLQVILAGQPEFDSMLDSPELRALRQRIVMRYSLSPLCLQDTIRYIANRVRIAGAERSPFTLDACRSVHCFSGGVPRLINLICDRAMLSGYAEDSIQVDRRGVEAAANELRLRPIPYSVTSRKLNAGSEAQSETGLRWPFGRRAATAAISLFIVLLAVVGILASRLYFAEGKGRPVKSAAVAAMHRLGQSILAGDSIKSANDDI